MFQVGDLRNGELKDVHGTQLKFYKDSSLNVESVMPHVVLSETGMPVHRLMRLVDTDDGLMVHVRWRGIPESEDTLEPVEKVFQDVPGLFNKLLALKNTPAKLATEVRRLLPL